MSDPNEQHAVTLGEVARNVNSLRSELKESLDSVGRRLDRVMDRVISSDVYAGDKSTTEYRLNDLGKEIEAVRHELRDYKTETSTWRRGVILSMIWPAVLVVANIIFTLWLTKG